jgi:hypothetical protein
MDEGKHKQMKKPELLYTQGVLQKLSTHSFQGAHLSRGEAPQISCTIRLSQKKGINRPMNKK